MTGNCNKVIGFRQHLLTFYARNPSIKCPILSSDLRTSLRAVNMSGSRSGGGGQVKVRIKVEGPPGQHPGEGLGPPPRSQSGGSPRSRSGPPLVKVQPPLSRSKNAGSAGGTPLAVTQEDCLVMSLFEYHKLQ